MNKRNTFLVVLVLILVIVSTSLFAFYDNYFLEQEPESPEEPETPTEPEPSVFWQIDLENFISDIVYDDNRVFVVDGVNIICLSKTNGEVYWRKTVGHTTSRSKLLIYEDKVYAGTYGGIVTSFNKYTGEEMLQFQAPVSTTWGGKSSPQDFFIEDGRLFVYQNGLAVFNATTGELFYEHGGYTIELGSASNTTSESSFIFMLGATRINPNNGEILWGLQGRASDPAVISQDKVILWNYNPDGGRELGHFIYCVDSSSGTTLWSFDVSSLMYQPIVYNEQVLFGAYDGNFYALNESNGDLAWKTPVSNQNNQTKIPGNEYRDLTPVISPIKIETNKSMVVWSFAFIQNGWGGVINYVGTVSGIDLEKGTTEWTKPIENNSSISSNNLLFPTSLGLSLLDDYAFLTVGSDFFIINIQNGNVINEKNYDHHLLRPTATNDLVFVAEELHLITYR